VFALARSYGLHTTVHAGEAAGPDSIWGAINALKPERIGHAGRAIEDPALVEYYVTHNLALECCPLSNVRTNVYASVAAHPVGMFIARGMRVTINTDDPKMFHNTLADEYAALVESHGLTRRDICRLIETAVDVSWLAPDARSALQATLSAHPDWVRD
jgi:adenosine deaminase